MKKTYSAPVAEKISFAYREQVVASNSCYWEGGDHWAYATESCKDQLVEGTPTQVG